MRAGSPSIPAQVSPRTCSQVNTEEFSMHNIQGQTNCLVNIDRKNELQFLHKNTPFKGAKSYLVGLKLDFRDWKPVKNTFHWNISGTYANVGKFSESFRK